MEQIRGLLCLHVKIRCGLLSITTPVPLPVNDFDARSVMHANELGSCYSYLCLS